MQGAAAAVVRSLNGVRGLCLREGLGESLRLWLPCSVGPPLRRPSRAVRAENSNWAINGVHGLHICFGEADTAEAAEAAQKKLRTKAALVFSTSSCPATGREKHQPWKQDPGPDPALKLLTGNGSGMSPVLESEELLATGMPLPSGV